MVEQTHNIPVIEEFTHVNTVLHHAIGYKTFEELRPGDILLFERYFLPIRRTHRHLDECYIFFDIDMNLIRQTTHFSFNWVESARFVILYLKIIKEENKENVDPEKGNRTDFSMDSIPGYRSGLTY